MNPLFPTEAVDTLTSIVNNGQVLSRRREIGAAAATVVAWLFSAMYATGREAVDELSDEVVGKLEDVLHSLHTAQEHFARHDYYCRRNAVAAGGENHRAIPQAGIDPATIGAIITLIQMVAPMVAQLLDWFRERRKQRTLVTGQ